MKRHTLVIFTALLLRSFATTYGEERELSITSTITTRVTAGDVEALSNGRSLWIGTRNGSDADELRLPDAMYSEFLDVNIGDIELSSDGGFLFIVLNGAEGIYRYSMAGKNWKTVRPADASRSVSCITRTSRGDILIGCGGYTRNTASNLTGVFRSTDNGTTWSKVEITLSQGALPGIVDVAETESGLITFLGRRVTGSAQGGAYTQTSSGSFVLQASILGFQVVAAGEAFYIQEPKLLQYAAPSASDVTRKVVVGDANIVSVSQWAGDTILVMCTKPDSSLAYMILVVNGTIAFRSPDLDFITDYSRPRAFVMDASTKKVLVCGSGIRQYVLGSEATTDVQVVPYRPIVNRAFSCDDFAYLRVQQHGWYRVDNTGNASLVGQELASRLEWCSTSAEMQLKSQILAVGKNVVYLITEASVDSIAMVPRTQPVTKLAMSTSGSKIAVVISDSIFILDRATGIWTEHSGTNWPSFQDGDTQKRLGLDGVYYTGEMLCAWFRGASYPVDHHDVGGLHVLQGEAWQRVSSTAPYRTTELMLGSVNGENGVFYCVESATSGQVVAQNVARLSSGGNTLEIEGDTKYTVPYVNAVYASGGFVGWVTAYGQMFAWSDSRLAEGDQIGTYALYTSPLEQSVVVSTIDRGVLLYPHSDLVSSVDESPRDNATTKLARPCGENRWCVEILDCGHERFVVDQFDIQGRLLKSEVKYHIDGEISFTGPSSKVAGPIFVVLSDMDGSCSFTTVVNL